MAGLLSGLMSGQFTDDPEQNKLITQGLLNFGLNLMQSRGRLGQGIGQSGLAAIQGVNEYKQQQYREQLRKQQQEEYDRVKKQRGLEDQFRQNLVSPEMLASQNALAGGGGPTTENATKIQPVDPNEKLMYDAMRSGLMSPLDYIKMRQKDDSLIPVPEGGSLVTRSGVLKYNSPKAPKDDRTADQRDYAAAVAQGYKGSFIDYQREMANLKAPKTTVSVNTGQKGLDNELGLKKDFRNEPIYKEYTDMNTAYKQIKAGIAQANPVGDLAAATKIMKLLDPTSVVRESELALAMAAAGKIDRLKHIVEIQIKGQKLTPTQRKEFGELAEELYDAAGQSYNQKRSEYAGIADKYKIDTSGLGPKHSPVRMKGSAAKKITNPAPAGLDPVLWQYMTPDEQAEWPTN